MWIRSQNRKILGDYKNIFILNKEIRSESNLNVDILGVYDSEKRTFEILDEIQKYLYCGSVNLTSGDGRVIFKDRVYQMPEK